MNRYEVIVEALQDMVDNDYITFEDAEIINDLAYDKYVTEDGHSKKLKARHKNQKKNIEKRFYDNMGFKYGYTDEKGNKHGTVQRGDGHKVDIVINKKPDKKEEYEGPAFLWDKKKHKNFIKFDRRDVLRKGSDLVGAHEYSHALDFNKNNAYTATQLGQENI